MLVAYMNGTLNYQNAEIGLQSHRFIQWRIQWPINDPFEMDKSMQMAYMRPYSQF